MLREIFRILEKKAHSFVLKQKPTCRAGLLALTLAIYLSQTVSADSQDPILVLPEDTVLLNFSASADRSVEQDELVAQLRAYHKARTAKDAQNEVNKLMSAALKSAKAKRSVKEQTGSYQIYEWNDRKSQATFWVAQQTITLSGLDSEAVLELAKTLQSKGLQMTSLNYRVSKALHQKTQDELMEEALKRLQQQADRAAKVLGKRAARIAEVTMGAEHSVYFAKNQRLKRSASLAAESDMAGPVADAGEAEISVTVNGRALLSD